MTNTHEFLPLKQDEFVFAPNRIQDYHLVRMRRKCRYCLRVSTVQRARRDRTIVIPPHRGSGFSRTPGAHYGKIAKSCKIKKDLKPMRNNIYIYMDTYKYISINIWIKKNIYI